MNLLVRADAGAKMGTGHVMRRLALAQAWQDAGGTARFAMIGPPEGILARLAAEGIEVVSLSAVPGSADDARQTVALARQCAAAWVVVDGYQFSGEYERAVKEAGLKLLAIDDYGHAGHYWADLVLNQNLHAEEDLYRNREPYTGLLLGTRFALLRREFWKWRGWRRETAETGRKLLVTLGGGDPDNVTLKVIASLKMVSVPELEAVVLSGPANPHFAELEAAVRAHDRPVRLLHNVADMPELVGLGRRGRGGGGIELLGAGLHGPSQPVARSWPRTRPLGGALSARGAALNLGKPEIADVAGIARYLTDLMQSKPNRETMAAAGRSLIDGEGARGSSSGCAATHCGCATRPPPIASCSGAGPTTPRRGPVPSHRARSRGIPTRIGLARGCATQRAAS